MVDDAHSVAMLIEVLKGRCELVAVDEVQKRHDGQLFTMNGLFAVPAIRSQDVPLPPDVQRMA